MANWDSFTHSPSLDEFMQFGSSAGLSASSLPGLAEFAVGSDNRTSQLLSDRTDMAMLECERRLSSLDLADPISFVLGGGRRTSRTSAGSRGSIDYLGLILSEGQEGAQMISDSSGGVPYGLSAWSMDDSPHTVTISTGAESGLLGFDQNKKYTFGVNPAKNKRPRASTPTFSAWEEQRPIAVNSVQPVGVKLHGTVNHCADFESKGPGVNVHPHSAGTLLNMQPPPFIPGVEEEKSSTPYFKPIKHSSLLKGVSKFKDKFAKKKETKAHLALPETCINVKKSHLLSRNPLEIPDDAYFRSYFNPINPREGQCTDPFEALRMAMLDISKKNRAKVNGFLFVICVYQALEFLPPEYSETVSVETRPPQLAQILKKCSMNDARLLQDTHHDRPLTDVYIHVPFTSRENFFLLISCHLKINRKCPSRRTIQDNLSKAFDCVPERSYWWQGKLDFTGSLKPTKNGKSSVQKKKKVKISGEAEPPTASEPPVQAQPVHYTYRGRSAIVTNAPKLEFSPDGTAFVPGVRPGQNCDLAKSAGELRPCQREIFKPTSPYASPQPIRGANSALFATRQAFTPQYSEAAAKEASEAPKFF